MKVAPGISLLNPSDSDEGSKSPFGTREGNHSARFDAESDANQDYFVALGLNGLSDGRNRMAIKNILLPLLRHET